MPAVVYALTVSSRQVVASPDAAAAALVASSIGGLAVAGSADYLTLALAQAILGGVMFLLLAVFKLGFLANFLLGDSTVYDTNRAAIAALAPEERT